MFSKSLRIAKSGVRTNVNWAALSSSLTSDSAKQEVTRFRAVISEIDNLHSKYANKLPPSIDFEAYKKKIQSKGVVEIFEKEYNDAKGSLPTFKSEDSEEIVGEKALQASIMLEAKAAIAESVARIAELEASVAVMKSKRMGRNTTVDDVYAAFPQIKKEVEEEVENHEWHKDIA